MGWDPPNKIKYLYKRIRFGRIEGESKRFKVFTIVNPVGASKVITTSLKTENCEYISMYISRVGNIFKVDKKRCPNAKNMRIYYMNL